MLVIEEDVIVAEAGIIVAGMAVIAIGTDRVAAAEAHRDADATVEIDAEAAGSTSARRLAGG